MMTPEAVVAPLDAVEPHAEHAGVASSPITLEPFLRPHAKPPAPAKLDTVDPWTGEDLAPQLELAAMARIRPELDRTDAWDPSIRYESAPGHEDPRLDVSDPWKATASLDGDPAPVRAKLAHHQLADEDPWAVTPAGRSAKSATSATIRPSAL